MSTDDELATSDKENMRSDHPVYPEVIESSDQVEFTSQDTCEVKDNTCDTTSHQYESIDLTTLPPIQTLRAISSSIRLSSTTSTPLVNLLASFQQLSALYLLFFGSSYVSKLLIHDLNENISKIRSFHQKHPQVQFLPSLLECEIQLAGGTTKIRVNRNSACFGALWICRSYRLIIAFCDKFAQDKTPLEAAQAAYEDVMSKYYSYSISMIVKIALRLIPSNRDEFLRRFQATENATATENMTAIENAIDEAKHLQLSLSSFADDMHDLLCRLQINFDDKISLF
jgi:Glycolipid transfer protein (GLTP)